MGEYATPEDISLDELLGVLEAYYLSSNRENVDIEDQLGVSEEKYDKQEEFLHQIGFLTEGDDLELSELGQEISEGLYRNNEDIAKTSMGALLRTWSATEELRELVENSEVKSEHKIINDVFDCSINSGTSTVVELFKWARIIEQNNDGDYRYIALEPEDRLQLVKAYGENVRSASGVTEHASALSDQYYQLMETAMGFNMEMNPYKGIKTLEKAQDIKKPESISFIVYCTGQKQKETLTYNKFSMKSPRLRKQN